jgi:(p)ppGpp synthase/HD superfamily hydrolase
MRALIFVPLLAMAGCQVTKDDANDSVTAQYNEEVAENIVEELGNTAEAVANDVEETADKLGNRLENVDVDVDIDTNKAN